MKRIIKLSEWAKEKNINYQTAHRKFKSGEIEGSFKNKTGRVFVEYEMNIKNCPHCKKPIEISKNNIQKIKDAD